ncbi:hypothetical protein M3Y94_00633500 [Aphelenchoides besseyi]|nr:hypothetical protein M3Y94_00633500 [Aphelenchoides besseyi]
MTSAFDPLVQLKTERCRGVFVLPDPAQLFWPSTADYVNGNQHIYATPSSNCQPTDDAIRINGNGGYASIPTFASVYAVPATSNGYQSDYSVDTAESESLIHYENNLERHKGKKRRLISG